MFVAFVDQVRSWFVGQGTLTNLLEVRKGQEVLLVKKTIMTKLGLQDFV